MSNITAKPKAAAEPTPPPAAPPKRSLLGKHGVFWIGLLVAAAVLIGFISLLFAPSGKSGSLGILAVGQTAPSFSAQTAADGKAITLAQFKGHPVVINFWGTFCIPCRSETPLLQRTYAAHSAAGLMILGIDQAEPADSVAQYGKDYGLTYPLIPDGNLTINKAYGVTALPVTYFIDAKGIIRSATNGVLSPGSLASGLQSIGIIS
ncbi:MAG: TlpA family protein disulfide reductase [Ktedonobacterales bacterium]|nr:TlpA family protein disulfide reductase [Ktedonobacterales bacterium]